jgi:hypothetical protein
MERKFGDEERAKTIIAKIKEAYPKRKIDI